MKGTFPFVAAFLVLATLTASFTIATLVLGSPWSTVPVLQLRNYGVDNAQLSRGQWWRLITAQFVHVKQAHTLFTAAALLLLGVAVERAAGHLRLALVWLISGVAGTYASIYSVQPPYDIGSGGSQALMGVAAAAIILMSRHNHFARWVKPILIITIVIQTGLDLISSHHPKPGHLVGFLVGLTLAFVLTHKFERLLNTAD